MNYSGIIENDVANGLGVRTSLFVSGCRNNCPGCFNKEQQDFNYGKEFTEDTIEYILESVKSDSISGISILGGEPLDKDNAPEVNKLIQAFRDRYSKDKDIWLYTGYTYENLFVLRSRKERAIREILESIDYLVDGPFIEAEKDIRLAFRGSRNQRIIDMNATRKDPYRAQHTIYSFDRK